MSQDQTTSGPSPQGDGSSKNPHSARRRQISKTLADHLPNMEAVADTDQEPHQLFVMAMMVNDLGNTIFRERLWKAEQMSSHTETRPAPEEKASA